MTKIKKGNNISLLSVSAYFFPPVLLLAFSSVEYLDLDSSIIGLFLAAATINQKIYSKEIVIRDRTKLNFLTNGNACFCLHFRLKSISCNPIGQNIGIRLSLIPIPIYFE